MSKRPFHLAWFLSQGYGPKTWRSAWPGSDVARWMMPDLFLDLARGMERACFDYLIIEELLDGALYVPRHARHLSEIRRQHAETRSGRAGAVSGAGDKHLGLVPTLSVTEYPPFLLARLVNSLDHVTEGRIGWNCVTSSNDGAAQNYGRDGQVPHDERYDLADEFADLVTKLWDAWEPDAVVLDREAPLFADGSKVHAVNHEGKYFRCRGPLNAPRSPQGRPVICQAGGSAARPAVRGPLGRHDHHRCGQCRGDENLPRRGPSPGRIVRARSGRRENSVPGVPDGRHHDGSGARTAAVAARGLQRRIWICSCRRCRA